MDDWVAVKKAWDVFFSSKKCLDRVSGDPIFDPSASRLEAFCRASLASDTTKVMGVYNESRCLVLAFLQDCTQVDPVVNEAGRLMIESKLYTLVRLVFSVPGAPSAAVRLMDEHLVLLARAKGHSKIVGNCRMSIPLAGAKSYGYVPEYQVLVKKV